MSFAVLAAWVAIAGLGGLFFDHSERSLIEIVSSGVVWQIAAAVLFLLGVILVLQWDDIGFQAVDPIKALRLMWLPLVYLGGFLALMLAVGVPSRTAATFIVINTILVGVSEELMFRGILFAGLRTRLPLLPSVWICSALFGLVHVLNALQTGHLAIASLQALAAFMTGMILMALRVRLGSLYPVIALHAAWDCLTLLALSKAGGMPNGDQLPAMAYLAPLFGLPNLVYALYLLRPKAPSA